MELFSFHLRIFGCCFGTFWNDASFSFCADLKPRFQRPSILHQIVSLPLDSVIPSRPMPAGSLNSIRGSMPRKASELLPDKAEKSAWARQCGAGSGLDEAMATSKGLKMSVVMTRQPHKTGAICICGWIISRGFKQISFQKH